MQSTENSVEVDFNLIGLFCSDFQIVGQVFGSVVFTVTSYPFWFDLYVKKKYAKDRISF